ncbi:MAG: tetratricopeptide repeat protein [Saprospiraceae bacterium]
MKKRNFAHFQEIPSVMNRLLYFVLTLMISVLGLNGQTLQDGIKQLENENYETALNTFTKLSNADGKNALYQYYIGEVYYALENTDAARTAYNKGLAINPKCDECRIGLGKLEIDKKNLAEAKKQFESALKGNGKNHAIIDMVGMAYLYNKNPQAQQALEYFTKARDLDPKIVKYWIHKGDAHVLADDLGAAMTAYEVAVEKNKNEPETYVKMARIWNSSGKYELAIEKLENAVKLDANNALVYKELYESYIKSRNFSKVIPVLEKYVALAGDDIGAKVRLVKFLCFQAKDYERAIEEGNKIIKTNPEQYTINRWLAWSYAETNRAQESFNANKQLFDTAGKNPEIKLYASDYEYFGKASAKLKKMDTAEWAYKKVVEQDSSRQLDVYGILAKAYYDNKDYVNAEKYYVAKNNLKKLNNSELYYLAQAQFFNEAYSRADSSFAMVLESTPNYAPAWIMRAKCNVNLDPDNVNFLAKPYFEKYVEVAEVDKAKEYVKKNLILAYNYLGVYFVQQNDNTTAKSWFARTITLDPNDATASDALRILNKK